MEDKKLTTRRIEEVLKKHNETITSVCFEGDSVCFHYCGVPLGYDALKEIEALVFENVDKEGFNKIIPFGMNGEYSLSVALPVVKTA